jgi:hypothetical protein
MGWEVKGWLEKCFNTINSVVGSKSRELPLMVSRRRRDDGGGGRSGLIQVFLMFICWKHVENTRNAICTI